MKEGGRRRKKQDEGRGGTPGEALTAGTGTLSVVQSLQGLLYSLSPQRHPRDTRLLGRPIKRRVEVCHRCAQVSPPAVLCRGNRSALPTSVRAEQFTLVMVFFCQ